MFSLRVLLSIFLIFYQFQPGVALKNAAYKRKVCINITFSKETLQRYLVLIYFSSESSRKYLITIFQCIYILLKTPVDNSFHHFEEHNQS